MRFGRGDWWQVRGLQSPVSRSLSMLQVLCMRPTAKPVGKSRPVDLACAEDRPLRVKRSLLSPANVNPTEQRRSPGRASAGSASVGHNEHALPRQRSGLWRDPTRRSGDPGYRLSRCARVPLIRLASVSFRRELCERRCVRRSLRRCSRPCAGATSSTTGAFPPRCLWANS
jgi:hypothetical protein